MICFHFEKNPVLTISSAYLVSKHFLIGCPFIFAISCLLQVKLGHGDNLNDFDKYGIDIYVKFRENVAMSKLDPFTQSGGERSVSTALYMLALQHLTKVPFRCVDEINQGMDAKNER